VGECWLATGPPHYWRIAFERGNIWGVRNTPRLRKYWQQLTQGDRLFFYATRPVGGVIGHGTIRGKFKQDRPLWPQEVKETRVIWPLRFEFDVEFCLAQDEWQARRFISPAMRGRAQSGFVRLPKQLAKEIAQSLEPPEVPSVKEEPGEYGVLSVHGQVIDKLKQIGKLQGYIPEKEYSMDIGRLDVVWRRVEKAVPMYVFEVQIGGDVFHALAKLKHAYDIWNSRIYLVANEDDRARVNRLLAGTFHEIATELRFIPLRKVTELYNRKKGVRDLESELGI